MPNLITSSTGVYYVPSSASTVATVPTGLQIAPARKARTSARTIQNAIFAHMQAMRALGRTQLSTGEIATALSISRDDVQGALASLRKRGVKIQPR
jgi:DNA-binding CsgD family transcriptional regulator